MADRDRDTFIKCGICSEKFDKPKILPCFHTVCHKCLENIVELTAQNGRFECPFCRMGIRVPENGASGFQTNFYIYSSDVISELDCDVCGVSQSAIHECKQCDQNFCKGCGSIHSRIASSANHTLVNISSRKKENDKGPASAPCNNHPSMKITDVCKDCNELVCTACVTLFHVGHSCSAVSKEAEERRNELRELISISENNLIEMEKDTRVVKRQSESKYKFFNEQICELRKNKESLIAKINEKFKSCEEKIKHLNDEQLMLANQMNDTRKNYTTNVHKIIENSRQIIESSEDALLLTNYESVSNDLNGIKEELAPAVSGKPLMETVERCTAWLITLNQHIENI